VRREEQHTDKSPCECGTESLVGRSLCRDATQVTLGAGSGHFLQQAARDVPELTKVS
jgi:hypothetical protein